ncbi:hypothetical protein Ga0074812_11917 [Parafrankia irregularis]|uniref:Uncharacterized protein n=1 Tax=Parafrankia irregularis TaxID=795642 RepID=A0A0S4QS05_9ACTN|nr:MULTISPECIES: hypothetical protein [Parafrankia]MBE3204536.1 hypothetical protein [Parafrankia sp. CH37]CUU58385.1 hypothetical protein Ga0074812_11917 [Parafrankia irregularis]
MELTPLVGMACNTSGCPTIYTTEGTDLVVQGYIVPDRHGAGEVPEGETLVRIPRQLLVDAIRKLPAVDG